MPVVRWKANAPNVFRYSQLDSTEPTPIRIKVDNVCCSARIRLNNVDLDFHPGAQWNGSRDQRAMKVDYDRFTLADERFSDTPSLDHHL
jgi:hypothetical protein